MIHHTCDKCNKPVSKGIISGKAKILLGTEKSVWSLYLTVENKGKKLECFQDLCLECVKDTIFNNPNAEWVI